MAKAKSVLFQMKCEECKNINYTTSKNPAENKGKLELKKFCKTCRKRTPHKEVKISKPKK